MVEAIAQSGFDDEARSKILGLHFLLEEVVAVRSFPATTGRKLGRRLEKIRRDWDGDFEGKRYAIRDLEYYECPACGELVFDREAMRKIEARSPAFERARIKRTV